VEDKLPTRIRDGVRYERGKRARTKTREGIAAKLSADKENDEARRVVKKAKATYIVDSTKFAPTATEEQLAMDLTEEDLGTEETHKILQCKIR